MHDAALARAVRALQKNPALCARDSSSVVSDLVHAWGNPWSAREDYLRDCIRHASSIDGPVLECGSGLTTLVLGIIAQQRGIPCWSLEHDASWAARARAALVRYGVTAVTIAASPLRTYDEGFDWYDPPLADMPTAFRLIVCDGPPASTRGGRYGLVPLMRARMARGCVILLDDAARAAERSILARWARELAANAEIKNGRRPYARLALPA